ncbi:hypothetical protein ABK040_008501 [Willaertia magna]
MSVKTNSVLPLNSMELVDDQQPLSSIPPRLSRALFTDVSSSKDLKEQFSSNQNTNNHNHNYNNHNNNNHNYNNNNNGNITPTNSTSREFDNKYKSFADTSSYGSFNGSSSNDLGINAFIEELDEEDLEFEKYKKEAKEKGLIFDENDYDAIRYKKNILTLTYKEKKREEEFLEWYAGSDKLRWKIMLGLIIILQFYFLFYYDIQADNIVPPFIVRGCCIGLSILFYIPICLSTFKWLKFKIPFFIVELCSSIITILVCCDFGLLHTFYINDANLGNILSPPVLLIEAVLLIPIAVRYRFIFLAPSITISSIASYIASYFIFSIGKWTVGRFISCLLEIIIVNILSLIYIRLLEGILRNNWMRIDKLGLKERIMNKATKKSEKLLKNLFPKSIIKELKIKSSQEILHHIDECCILHCDVVNFTRWSSTTPAPLVVKFLNMLFSEFDKHSKSLKVEKLKTIGDCYVCTTNVPDRIDNHTFRMAEMSLRLLESLDKVNLKSQYNMQIRIGVAVGPATVCIVGSSKMSYELFGNTVKESSFMEQTSNPGRIHVSKKFKELIDQLGHTDYYWEIRELDISSLKVPPQYLAHIPTGTNSIETYFLYGANTATTVMSGSNNKIVPIEGREVNTSNDSPLNNNHTNNRMSTHRKERSRRLSALIAKKSEQDVVRTSTSGSIIVGKSIREEAQQKLTKFANENELCDSDTASIENLNEEEEEEKKFLEIQLNEKKLKEKQYEDFIIKESRILLLIGTILIVVFEIIELCLEILLITTDLKPEYNGKIPTNLFYDWTIIIRYVSIVISIPTSIFTFLSIYRFTNYPIIGKVSAILNIIFLWCYFFGSMNFPIFNNRITILFAVFLLISMFLNLSLTIHFTLMVISTVIAIIGFGTSYNFRAWNLIYLLQLGIVFIIFIIAVYLIHKSMRESFELDNSIMQQIQQIEKTKEESDRLMSSIVPPQIISRLKRREIIADNIEGVTVTFIDCEVLQSEFLNSGCNNTFNSGNYSVNNSVNHGLTNIIHLITMLSDLFDAFDELCKEYQVEKIKSIQTVFMAASGLFEGYHHNLHKQQSNSVLNSQELNNTTTNTTATTNNNNTTENNNNNNNNSHSLLKNSLSRSMVDLLEKDSLSVKKKSANNMIKLLLNLIEYIEEVYPKKVILKIGFHTGSLVSAVIGIQAIRFDIISDTVNFAARLQTSCDSNVKEHEVQTSDVTYQILKDDYTFSSKGEIELKGKGKVPVYTLDWKHYLNE